MPPAPGGFLEINGRKFTVISVEGLDAYFYAVLVTDGSRKILVFCDVTPSNEEA